MSKLKITNGTPIGSLHLCRNCRHGQFTVGYRETDVLVVCSHSNPARTILFPVYECTQFWDRNRPSYFEMTKLALDFSEGHRKPIKGFGRDGAAQHDPIATPADDDDEEEEAARTDLN
jgi:hypothetical protein